MLNVRVVRNISPTTLVVGSEGQKTYWAPTIGGKNKQVGYSSGAQIKRYIIDTAINSMTSPVDEKGPYTFGFKIVSGKTKEDVVYKPCNPMYAEDLFGGWMKTESNKTKKSENEDDETEEKNTIKRRAPISVSGLFCVHPFLASTFKDSVTVNKEDRENIFVIKDKTAEEVAELKKSDKNIRPTHYKVDSTTRMHGMYYYDTVINENTLFTFGMDEVQSDVLKKLIDSSQWKLNEEEQTITLVDTTRRVDIIKALVHGIIFWQPYTNQSSAYSNSPVLSITITDDASEINPSVLPIIGDGFVERLEFNTPKNGKLFITPSMLSHQVTEGVDKDALENAKKYLIDSLNERLK